MAIKILHTADNHIGMKFSNKPVAAREALLKERFDALSKIVELGNSLSVNFLVIAGDLFDSTLAKLGDIKQTATLLKQFNGEAVIIVPGNHDFYENATESLWKKFEQHVQGKNIFILGNYEMFEQTLGDNTVVFYPACCRSLHSADHMIGWVKQASKNAGAINIGIAHGNVTGLGLDENQQYFNMSTEELNDAGMDFWLLGHIHVPFPVINEVNHNPGYFMPGTHTPDGWDRKQAGSCWLIEVQDDKSVNASLQYPGSLRFYDWSRTVSSSTELEKLKNEIAALDPTQSLLRLNITGRLPEEEIVGFNEYLKQKIDEFLLLEPINKVKMTIDKAYIDKHYTQNSVPYILLSELAAEDADGLSLQLAQDLIEKMKA